MSASSSSSSSSSASSSPTLVAAPLPSVKDKESPTKTVDSSSAAPSTPKNSGTKPASLFAPYKKYHITPTPPPWDSKSYAGRPNLDVVDKFIIETCDTWPSQHKDKVMEFLKTQPDWSYNALHTRACNIRLSRKYHENKESIIAAEIEEEEATKKRKKGQTNNKETEEEGETTDDEEYSAAPVLKKRRANGTVSSPVTITTKPKLKLKPKSTSSSLSAAATPKPPVSQIDTDGEAEMEQTRAKLSPVTNHKPNNDPLRADVLPSSSSSSSSSSTPSSPSVSPKPPTPPPPPPPTPLSAPVSTPTPATQPIVITGTIKSGPVVVMGAPDLITPIVLSRIPTVPGQTQTVAPGITIRSSPPKETKTVRDVKETATIAAAVAASLAIPKTATSPSSSSSSSSSSTVLPQPPTLPPIHPVNSGMVASSSSAAPVTITVNGLPQPIHPPPPPPSTSPTQPFRPSLELSPSEIIRLKEQLHVRGGSAPISEVFKATNENWKAMDQSFRQYKMGLQKRLKSENENVTLLANGNAKLQERINLMKEEIKQMLHTSESNKNSVVYQTSRRDTLNKEMADLMKIFEDPNIDLEAARKLL